MWLNVSDEEAQAIIDGLKLQSSSVYDYGGKLPDGTEVADHDGTVEERFGKLIKKLQREPMVAVYPDYIIAEVPWVEQFYHSRREDLYDGYARYAVRTATLGDADMEERDPGGFEVKRQAKLAAFSKEWEVEFPADSHIDDICRAMAHYEHETGKYESIEGNFEEITILCLDMFLNKFTEAYGAACHVLNEEWSKAGNKDAPLPRPERVKVPVTSTEVDCLLSAARYALGEDYGYEDAGWAGLYEREEMRPLAMQLEFILGGIVRPDGTESIFEGTVC